MQLRNPWAEYEWGGAWGDDSPQWTDELKEAYGYEESKDDGNFFIPWNAYTKRFAETFINYDPSDLFRADWLMLDDTTKDSPGSDNKCGEM